MKEKIIEILNKYIVTEGNTCYCNTEVEDLADEIILAIDQSQFTADEAEEHINQEVEHRIKERMPSEEEQDKWADYCAGNTTSDHNKAVLYKAALSLGATWLRSRLTNDSQKTEGGEE